MRGGEDESSAQCDDAGERSNPVLTTGITAVKQWRREILDKTDLNDVQVAEYTGDTKKHRQRSPWRPTRL